MDSVCKGSRGREGPGGSRRPSAGWAPQARAGVPPAARRHPACPRRSPGYKDRTRGPSREGADNITWRGEGDWRRSPPLPHPVTTAPHPALHATRLPPARGRSAVCALPGSGARNSVAGARRPRSPRAPWRGGATALPGRQGGRGAGPGWPQAGLRPCAGLGAGPGAAGRVRGGARIGSGRGLRLGGGVRALAPREGRRRRLSGSFQSGKGQGNHSRCSRAITRVFLAGAERMDAKLHPC